MNGNQTNAPTFAICVPAYNEEAFIERLLDSLLSQRVCNSNGTAVPFTRYEVVVAIHPKTADNTIGVCRGKSEAFRQRNVPLRTVEGGTIPVARNNAAVAADRRARFLLFLDADCELPTPYYLCNLTKHLHNNPDIQFAAADCVVHPNDRNPLSTIMFDWLSSFQHLTRKPAGAFILINRNLFEQIGGFDPQIDFLEAWPFTNKVQHMAGARMMMLPNEFTFWTSSRKFTDPEKTGKNIAELQRGVTCYALPNEMCSLANLQTTFFDQNANGHQSDEHSTTIQQPEATESNEPNEQPDAVAVASEIYDNRAPDLIIKFNDKFIPMRQTMLGAWPNDHGGIKRQWRDMNPLRRPAAHLIEHNDGTFSLHFDRINPHLYPFTHLLLDVIQPVAEGKPLSRPIAIITP